MNRFVPGRRPTAALLASLGACAFAVMLAASCGRGSAPPPSAGEPAAATPPAEQAAAQADAPLSESAARLAALLPTSGTPGGWTLAAPPRRFGASELWEHIDGAAESVIAYGFDEMITAGYRHAPGGEEVTVDLYRMSGEVAAFGLFAQETEAGGDPLADGTEGVTRAGQAAFWHGPHYVKLTAFQQSPVAKAGLEALARAIAAAMGPAAPRPAVFARFPTRDLQPRSLRVVPKDALGQSYLPLAYQAAYLAGSKTWTLLLVPFEEAAACGGAYDRYRAFVTSGGAVSGAKAGAVDLFTGSDSYYGAIVAGRRGAEMAIAVGVPTPEAGRSAVASLLGHTR